MEDGEGSGRAQRIDKWLWHARFLKTRGLASRLVSDGKVRVNREKIAKPSHSVRPGDVITATIAGRVRVTRVVAIGERRGPPAEARTLYQDLLADSPAGHAAGETSPQSGDVLEGPSTSSEPE
jgi:ribosome-associated heat shock protein Hsp15